MCKEPILLLIQPLPLFSSGTGSQTTTSSKRIRVIAGCSPTSPFTCSGLRCHGNCGTSFRRSLRIGFSQTLRPPACWVSPRVKSCVVLYERLAFFLSLSHSPEQSLSLYTVLSSSSNKMQFFSLGRLPREFSSDSSGYNEEGDPCYCGREEPR